MTCDASGMRLSAWQNFYVIVGSAGAALIGIRFVVITLIAYTRESPPEDTVGAFGTPTVVHLSGALLVAAIMSAPWGSLWGVSVALGLCGVGGIGYSAIVVQRARRQTGYQPVGEDWLWYAILPCAVYAVLAVSAVLLHQSPRAMFWIAACALGLLFLGIHNAWDTVTHLVVTGAAADKEDSPGK
ncbi:MAG: hypothetical protein NVS9B15_06720 [Acidobacteriaceae bacterium]